MPATLKDPKLRQHWIKALILSLFAIGLNFLGIHVFFGFELLLGSSLSVLALLLLGDIGLLVGISASLVIWKVWGYPWCALVAIAELLWLRAYLLYFGDRDTNRSDGRIIIADILYWLIIGIPAAFLLFGAVYNLDPSSVFLLTIKQSLNGAINTTIGLALYLLYRIVQSRRDRLKAIPIHGLTMSTIVLAVIVPSLLILSMASSQLVQVTQQAELERLQMVAKGAAAATKGQIAGYAESLHDSGSLIEFELINHATKTHSFQSNPGLFKILSQNHVIDASGVSKVKELGVLSLERTLPKPERLINAYWRFERDRDWIGEGDSGGVGAARETVIAVEPARNLILQMQNQATQIIGILAWTLLFTVLLGEMLARALSTQFSLAYLEEAVQLDKLVSSSTLTGLTNPARPFLNPLKTGFLLDLNRIIVILNERSSLANQLRDDLQATSQNLRTTRQEVDFLNTIDPLTGCCNIHELYRRLDSELQRSNRDKSELSCLCLEIDHYKQIRESYGSTMADHVLIDIVAEINSRVRTTDCLCRSGESEFSLVLPMCSAEAASELAETFRRAIEGSVIRLENQQISVTISLGVSCLRRGNDDSESMIHRAENALYRAKAEGRNRIVTA